ncbi:MAG: hypothetical protein Q9221_002919 [Calogaya cf. arnoldii]
MPSLPDKSSRLSYQTSNSIPLDPGALQEGRSIGQRSKKKHDRGAEPASRDRASRALSKELASQPSLLSQLQPSSSPHPYASDDISSPLLAALRTFPGTEDTTQPEGLRGDWPENVSSDSSPPDNQTNGFSLAGTSPPVYQPTRGYSGGFSNVSPGSSPPATHAKLARRTSGYQSLGGYLSSSPGRERPVSGYSQRSITQHPPLPHHPQAHFYSAPQVDFGAQTTRESQGSTSCGCRVIGNIASAGAEGFGGAESVLLIGLQNGLDVFSFDNGRADRIGHLGNLRGTVIGAQLLPSSVRDDAILPLRPLVAVIINGPQQNERSVSHQTFRDQPDDALFDPSASTVDALEYTAHDDRVRTTFYQTTVEVYSLSRCEHITTLLKSAPAGSAVSQDPSRSTETPSNCDWALQACGRFVVVGSGRSGEVFVFETLYDENNTLSLAFKCIGKTWTSIARQIPRSRSRSSTEAKKPVLEESIGDSLPKREGAIFALSHRWLAVVPPNKSTKTTVHASVDLQQSHHKPPGISSHTSPQSPQPNCDLDTPGQESLLNKVARDVTQEFMKGACWVGDQGMRAWKNYWQKPPDPSTVLRPSSDTAGLPSFHDQLPPTHANSEVSSQLPTQRAIVAILDLEKLSSSQSAKDEVALHPLAAFALADGCSLVSFNPNGLSLLTASAKGDVQHVWSLMRMAHGALVHQTDLSHVHKAPSVRQIARFTRMTVARIVDVVWTEPGGERLALVTERGTVHIYDLPPSALQWPPPRRTMKAVISAAQSPKASPELDAAVPGNPSSGWLGSAMDFGRTQPLLAAIRGRPASIGNPFSGFSGMSLTAGAGIKSGKVVAAGFNRSVGAATGTVETIRHLGENRLTLPGPPHAAAPGRVRWLTGKHRGYLAVTGGEALRIHRISHSANAKPGKRRPSVAGNKPVELRVGDTIHHPARGMQWKGTAGKEPSDKPPSSSRSFWQGRAPRPVSGGEEDSLHSQAEIDTNAPYQPFHTDRRVNLHVYMEEDDILADVHHIVHDPSPWVFGEAISTIRTRTGAGMSISGDEVSLQQAGSIENHVRVQGNEKEGQQIVITTRRRKAGKADAAEGEEEEIFEDDCEVVDFADERV